jgi:hypothetical protein
MAGPLIAALSNQKWSALVLFLSNGQCTIVGIISTRKKKNTKFEKENRKGEKENRDDKRLKHNFLFFFFLIFLKRNYWPGVVGI